MHRFYLSTLRGSLILALFFLCNYAVAQQVVKGKVNSSDDGVSMSGVNVLEKGTSNGTATDADGNFALTVGDGATLVFSFIGYVTQEVVVGSKSVINISLAPDTKLLGEIVVVGYGTQKKADVTGAIVQVKGEEITKQSSINPLSSLQGKIPGVQITNSGTPGASPKVTIRGTGTVSGNSDPLYVVDGVWYSDITFLNPADIENISVLKDASSEAIYGVRAANGVILITTRKGTKNTKAVVNYTGYVGTQAVTNEVKMANGPEYANIINELDLLNPGGTYNNSNPRFANPSSYGTTDWNHQIYRSAPITNHQLSISGGSEKNTYNVSFGYTSQGGIVKTNSFKRYTARVQNDFQVADFFKLGYTLTGALNNSQDIDNGIFHQVYAASPITPVHYADGTYGDPNDFRASSANLFNPQATIDYYNQKTYNYRATGNIYGDLKFAKHFQFRTSAGFDFWLANVDNYVPVYTATLAQRSTVSTLRNEIGQTKNWLVENTLTYENEFNEHNVKVLVGQAAQNYDYTRQIATAQNVPNSSSGDHYLSLGNSRNVTDVSPGDYPSLYRIASYFSRVNYSYKERYFMNVSFRADGSSKFTGDNQWGYFPSVGAGWVLTEEDFMRSQHVVSNLKIRASWGKIGNSSVPANTSVLRVTQSPQFIYIGGNGTTAPGASINTVVPPATYWELGVGTDVGVEASFLQNKLSAEVDYYNKRTEKAIFAIPVLGSIGTQSSNIVGNQATFENKGFEFLVRWTEQKGDWNYSVSANLAINDNKVLAVSTGANPIYQAVGTTGSNNFNTRTVLGQPIGQFFGLKVAGIFQNGDEISNYKSSDGTVIQPNAHPGDFKYVDVNGDGVIDDKDRVPLGNPNPKYVYGVNVNVGYKAFDFTLDLQGVAGVDIYNANLGLRYGTENFTKDFYDHRWHGDGTSNTYPSANIGGGTNYRANSFYVEDGSYFRIRNIQLGYTLPSSVISKIKLTRARVYLNAQNAFNFFKYRGFSPEVGGDPTRAGVDVNVYPLAATYNVGVNITF